MINKFINFIKKISIRTALPIIGVLLVILSSVFLLWQGNTKSNQSIPVTFASVYFVGEYRIGDGEWKQIVDGEHISSTKGDVTLRGNFHCSSPDGKYLGIFKDYTPIAFYTDHLNLTFKQSGRSHVIDYENPLLGKSACGVGWTGYSFFGKEDVIEIVIHNPHNFGNENAIDQMLSNTAFWLDIEFEKDILEEGEIHRNVGLAFVIASVMFLGTALFSSLIHLKNTRIIWLLGLVIFFAGVYCIYSSFGISFWSESVVFNTSAVGISMMLYAFFLTMLITILLRKTRKISIITCNVLGFIDIIFFLLPTLTHVYFYDTWRYWSIVQCATNVVMIVCIIKELIGSKGKDILIYIGSIVPLSALNVDVISTSIGFWKGGLISKCIFILLFVVAIIVLIRIIPNSINAVIKAKKLETEKLILNTQLTESRVSLMISQIRPHFIYNTLGNIEQLCELNPPKAGELVHNFAKYLRGNFGELDNPKPILMSQEMEHVHYYVNIEKVRFPDMTFSFEMNSNDFKIPALTIQPIVENAIKHGLMKLSKGGSIKIVSYETNDDYCVLVQDDGIGFDTSALLDERKHVGIRNIRERLKAMVNGTLQIESEMGVGTKVLITIPKEKEL